MDVNVVSKVSEHIHPLATEKQGNGEPQGRFHPFQWTYRLCRLLCADVLAGVSVSWQVWFSGLQQYSCYCP